MTIRLLTLLLTVVGVFPASAAAQAPARPDYVIGPRDLIAVQVFGEPGASGTFRVEADGAITLPLIGRVQAGGKTLRETQNEITKALADGFFTNPQVSASIQEYGSQKIFVVGEVRNPGSYPLSGETTLLAALALAGSTLPTAGDTIIINRPKAAPPAAPAEAGTGAGAGSEGSDEFVRVSLRDLQSGQASSLNLRLVHGDTVFVPKVESIFVTGQVRNAGAFPFQDGLTVLQAVALAGGINDRGSMSRITIVRAVKGVKSEIKAKATDAVRAGDTILVKERFF
jgi:polysaccharide biosynthesis/export protein